MSTRTRTSQIEVNDTYSNNSNDTNHTDDDIEFDNDDDGVDDNDNKEEEREAEAEADTNKKRSGRRRRRRRRQRRRWWRQINNTNHTSTNIDEEERLTSNTNYIAHLLNNLSNNLLSGSPQNWAGGEEYSSSEDEGDPNKRNDPNLNITMYVVRWSRYSKNPLFANQRGLYLSYNHKTKEWKVGFIYGEIYCFHDRLMNIYHATRSVVTVIFISTNDALPKQQLQELETFVKFALFLQPIDDTNEVSAYSGEGEVFVGLNFVTCHNVMETALMLSSTDDNFELEVRDGQYEPLTREWKSHPLMFQFLFKAALQARNRHTHPLCEWSDGNSAGHDEWVYQERQITFNCCFNSTCPCMMDESLSSNAVLNIEEEWEGYDEDGYEDRGEAYDYNNNGSDGMTDEVEDHCVNNDCASTSQTDEDDTEEDRVMCGIRRDGQTCYIITVLQIFICQTWLLNKLQELLTQAAAEQKVLRLTQAVVDVASSMGMMGNNKYSKVGDISVVKKLVGEQYQVFAGPEQNDPHEFLMFFVNMMDSEFASLHNNTFSMREEFGATLVRSVQCTECYQERSTTEPVLFPFSVCITDGSSVEDCLVRYCNGEEQPHDFICPYNNTCARNQPIERLKFIVR